jgi:ribonuclease Y
MLIQKNMDGVREAVEQESKNVIAIAVQRWASEHTSAITTTTLDLPNDEMKGRIIGRDGRNIRAFEKTTGVDLIIDDTPGVIVISAFDGLRREMAKRALEKLIADGRIHPARIEEIVEATKQEMEQHILELGKQTCYDLDVHGLHPKLMALLGRLKYRTSYGQNNLYHTIEVAYLCSAIAGELKLDVKLAKRCGLLHDIGKAVDHELEGGHPAIGADLLKRFGESPDVVHSAAMHHESVTSNYIYTIITSAADAISASRPGARRDTVDKYIKRLERLEAIANSYQGVDHAYAIQAGREVRIIVNPEKVADNNTLTMARDIAKNIEKELTYPGEIKITVIRETRAIEYAR